jgi:hypothetical protein
MMNQIKKDETSGTCSIHGETRNGYKISVGKVGGKKITRENPTQMRE